MQYRRLGTTGMKVSAVALGGWTTFGEVITGATGTEQIEATAQAGEAQLTPDVIGKLDELFPAT